MSTSNLLPEVETFLGETGMSDYAFGFRAAKNGRLVERLRAGRRVWPDTEDQVRTFMAKERQRRAAGVTEQQVGAA